MRVVMVRGTEDGDRVGRRHLENKFLPERTVGLTVEPVHRIVCGQGTTKGLDSCSSETAQVVGHQSRHQPDALSHILPRHGISVLVKRKGM